MARRRTKRKLRITVVGRNPDNPLRLFHALDEAFRPGEIEVDVRTAASPLVDPVVEEELEKIATERATATLDRQYKESRKLIAQGPPETLALPSPEMPSQETLESWKRDHAKHQTTEIAKGKKAIGDLVVEAGTAGIRIVVRLLTGMKI